MNSVELIPSRYDFSDLAENYDLWYQTREGMLYDRFEKATVKKFLPPALLGMNLLDVGCGTGHWSEFFNDNGCAVTGIDISEAMVKTAQNKRSKAIRFLIGDAHKLPFSDGEFDVSVAIATIEFVRNPAGVIREMVRCTKKRGGIVLLGVLNCCAKINRQRRDKGFQPYKDAWLLSPRQLFNMLAPYGIPQIRPTAFVPRSRWLMSLGPVYNSIGTSLRIPSGAFIVGTVTL